VSQEGELMRDVLRAGRAAEEATKLALDYRRIAELLASALSDWAYQYPDQHLMEEHAEALKCAEAVKL